MSWVMNFWNELMLYHVVPWWRGMNQKEGGRLWSLSGTGSKCPASVISWKNSVYWVWASGLRESLFSLPKNCLRGFLRRFSNVGQPFLTVWIKKGFMFVNWWSNLRPSILDICCCCCVILINARQLHGSEYDCRKCWNIFQFPNFICWFWVSLSWNCQAWCSFSEAWRTLCQNPSFYYLCVCRNTE